MSRMGYEVTITDAAGSLEDTVTTEACDDMDEGLMQAMDLLGQPLADRDEGEITIKVKPVYV